MAKKEGTGVVTRRAEACADIILFNKSISKSRDGLRGLGVQYSELYKTTKPEIREAIKLVDSIEKKAFTDICKKHKVNEDQINKMLNSN